MDFEPIKPECVVMHWPGLGLKGGKLKLYTNQFEVVVANLNTDEHFV